MWESTNPARKSRIRARLYSLVKNLVFRPSEGAGGFSLPNKSPRFSVALATGLPSKHPGRLFHQAALAAPEKRKKLPGFNPCSTPSVPQICPVPHISILRCGKARPQQFRLNQAQKLGAPCPSHLGTWESANPSHPPSPASQLVILSDRSEAEGAEGPAAAFVFVFAFRAIRVEPGPAPHSLFPTPYSLFPILPPAPPAIRSERFTQHKPTSCYKSAKRYGR
jgi:hypothetical protein